MHPSIMWRSTDVLLDGFLFPLTSRSEGDIKNILQRTRLSLAHTAIVSSGIIFIFFNLLVRFTKRFGEMRF